MSGFQTPTPYGRRKVWPHLRGVRLVLALMAGTEWIPEIVGPHVTICNAHGAHNISTAEWTVSAMLAMLKYFPFYLDVQRAGKMEAPLRSQRDYAAITGDTRPLYPPVMLEELTGKRVLMVGYGAIGKEIERMLEPFNVELCAWPALLAPSPRSCRQRTRQPVAASRNCRSHPARHA
jgi:phosphoglycerate dehydrogenase-like enzyme